LGRDEKVDAFIEKNKIHLKLSADFDWTKLKKNSEAQEKVNAKIIMAHSVADFLLKDERVDKYITIETTTGHPELQFLKFDCYVFSGSQLKNFIDNIIEIPISRLISLN